MKRAGWAETAVVACILAALVLAIQSGLGSFSAEIADDDTSHYISGLFIHDYFRAGLPNPLNYLKLYHSHYPLLGFGGWGPAYYFVEAAWMFLFSPQARIRGHSRGAGHSRDGAGTLSVLPA